MILNNIDNNRDETVNYQPSLIAYSNLLLAGMSSSAATLCTIPLEVVRTRLQLQGELTAKGSTQVPYKGVGDALTKIVKHEGLGSLWKGLVPSLHFQFVFVSIRLGLFNTMSDMGFTKDNNGDVSLARVVFYGAISGMIGGFLATPFCLVRTQLQTQSIRKIAVGYQHRHKGMLDAFHNIYQAEGVKGLYRGGTIALPGGIFGNALQQIAITLTKDWLQDYTGEHPRLVSAVSSAIGSSVSVVFAAPIDNVGSRLYNQGVRPDGSGMLYSGLLDCFVKTVRTEGVSGLYKGIVPTCMRMFPHLTLILFIFDGLKEIRNHYLFNF